MRYAQYFNRRHKRSGHLWQGRFFSCLLDESHFQQAVIYVENNPVRAKLVLKSTDWPWSSAGSHWNGSPTVISLSGIKNCIDNVPEPDFLSANKNSFIEEIRRTTISGKVLTYSEQLIEKLELISGRQFLSRKPGRPRKTK